MVTKVPQVDSHVNDRRRVLLRTSAVKTTVETTVVSSQVASIVLRLVISIEECASWPPSGLAVVALEGCHHTVTE